MLRDKLDCLFNKEELFFPLLLFSLFLNSHSIIRGKKNNQLSWSQRSPSSFAHSHRAFTSSNPSVPSIGLWPIQQVSKSKVQWCFSLHNYLLMLTNGVTAVPFLGQDLCTKQSHVNNFPGWFSPSPHPPCSVPTARPCAELQGAAMRLEPQMGPTPPGAKSRSWQFLPRLGFASTGNGIWVFIHCDEKSQQSLLHPQNWGGAKKKEEKEKKTKLPVAKYSRAIGFNGLVPLPNLPLAGLGEQHPATSGCHLQAKLSTHTGLGIFWKHPARWNRN